MLFKESCDAKIRTPISFLTVLTNRIGQTYCEMRGIITHAVQLDVLPPNKTRQIIIIIMAGVTVQE